MTQRWLISTEIVTDGARLQRVISPINSDQLASVYNVHTLRYVRRKNALLRQTDGHKATPLFSLTCLDYENSRSGSDFMDKR